MVQDSFEVLIRAVDATEVPLSSPQEAWMRVGDSLEVLDPSGKPVARVTVADFRAVGGADEQQAG